jgi:small subunit ribosomal protein S7
MPRRKSSHKIKKFLDYKYKNLLVGKFINIVMQKGKKSIAEKIVYNVFSLIDSTLNENALRTFIKAVEKTSPLIEVRSKRIGGANYQVPVDVKYNRSITLSFRWIKNYAKSQPMYKMHQKLAQEIMNAAIGKGETIKKKENVHKMAEANKAFSHYLW